MPAHEPNNTHDLPRGPRVKVAFLTLEQVSIHNNTSINKSGKYMNQCALTPHKKKGGKKESITSPVRYTPARQFQFPTMHDFL